MEPRGQKLKIITIMQISVTASDNKCLSRQARTKSSRLVHAFPAHCSLRSLFGREVEFHLRDRRVICQTTGVLGHLQVDVAFLTPSGCPAVPHNPVRCWSRGVESNCHY